MKCPYCGSLVEEVNDICLNCERPLDYNLMRKMREAEMAARAAHAANERNLATLVLDPAIEQKAAQIHNPITYLLRVSLVVLGLAFVTLLITVPLLGWLTYPALIALAVGFIFLVLLGVAALSYGSSRKGIRRILAGEAQIAHWTYSEQEWQQFTAYAWRRGIKTDLVLAGVLVGMMLVISLVILGSAHGDPGAFGAVAACLGIAAAVSLLFFLKDVIILRLRRRQENSEAYVSLKGVILGGWCTALGRFYRVDYKTGDPAVLRLFAFKQGRYGRYTSITEVPVPHGREAEAEQVVQHLKEKGF